MQMKRHAGRGPHADNVVVSQRLLPERFAPLCDASPPFRAMRSRVA